MRRKRLFVLAACLLVILTGSGCWDREELENLGLVLSLGIDAMPKDRVEVTAQVAIPVRMGGGGKGGMGGGGQGPATQVVTETAPSIPEAFRAINRTINRRITLAQNRLIVFGDGTARKGLRRFLAVITRYREFRRTMQIMIVKGRAKDVMNLKPELEANPAEYLVDLGRLSRYTGETDLVSVNDFVKDMERLGTSPHATYLVPPSKKEKKKTLKIGGVAVFRGDRMAGVYGPGEVNAFLILARRFTENFQSLPDPTAPGHRIILHFTSAKARIKPHLYQSRAALSVDVLAEADLSGTETERDYTNPSLTLKIERAAAGLIERQLQEAVSRAKEDFQTDPFGLGEYFRLLMPTWSAWRSFRWQRRFPEAPVSIHTHVHIRRFGFQRQAPVPVF